MSQETSYSLPLVFVVTAASYLYIRYRRTAIFQTAKGPDGVELFPNPVPFLGHALELLKNADRFPDFLTEISKLTTKTTMFTLPFQEPRVYSNDPRNIEYVLKTEFESFGKGPAFHGRMKDVLGNGIFNVDGEKWKTQRKITSPLFSVNNFRIFLQQAFGRNIDKLNRVLESSVGQVIDLHDILHRYTMDGFCKVTFGIDVNSMNVNIPFAKAFDQLQQRLQQRFIELGWEFYEKFSQVGLLQKKNVQIIREFANSIVQHRKNEILKAQSGELNDFDQKADILTLYIKMHLGVTSVNEIELSQINDDELIDYVLNIVFAGRDTTAQAISWTFYELSKHPHVVETLRAEFDACLGTSEPSFDDLKPSILPYTFAVFAESLRLHPSVPINLRTALVDGLVLPDGTPMPKGAAFLWSPYAMARTKKDIWGDDATDFRPERWLKPGENGKKMFEQMSQYESVVFHAGPRICLGKNLAEIQAVFVLVQLLRKWNIKVVNLDDVAFKKGLTLRMAIPIMCEISRRTL